MVGIFASLKWRLVTRRYRTPDRRWRVGPSLGLLAGLLVALGAAVGLALLRGNPDWARIAVITFFTVQFLSWGLAPIVAFGVDETVEPAKFALLPLSDRTLRSGLLATALIGILPVLNVVLLLGCALALATRWWLLLPALIICAAQLLLCVVFSRALSTAMASLMSSRRGRDLGVLVGFGVFLVYFSFNLLLNTSGRSGTGLATGTRAVAHVLAWLPPGALASLPADLAAGDGLRIAYDAVLCVALAVVLWTWWGRSLRRSLTTVPSTTQDSAPAHNWMGSVTATSTTSMAVLLARRDLMLSWRDPMRRVGWLVIAFLAMAWPLLVVRGDGSIFAVGFWALFVGLPAANSYGLEGSAMWLHMVAFADRARARGEALGHALAGLLPGLVVVVVAAAVQLAVRGGWRYLPAASGLLLTCALAGCAAAVFVAPRLPFPMRQSRRSMFANSVPGQTGRTAGSNLAVLGLGILIALPTAACVVLAFLVDPGWGWVGLPVGIAVGVLALIGSVRSAARVYSERGPEILARVALGDRA